MKATLSAMLICTSISLQAQVARNSELFNNLRAQDSIFFERSFNRCDIEYLDGHIAADLKFFHD